MTSCFTSRSSESTCSLEAFSPPSLAWIRMHGPLPLQNPSDHCGSLCFSFFFCRSHYVTWTTATCSFPSSLYPTSLTGLSVCGMLWRRHCHRKGRRYRTRKVLITSRRWTYFLIWTEGSECHRILVSLLDTGHHQAVPAHPGSKSNHWRRYKTALFWTIRVKTREAQRSLTSAYTLLRQVP